MDTGCFAMKNRRGRIVLLATVALAVALLAAGLILGPVTPANAGPFDFFFGPSPSVSSITPTSGSISGGNAVVIKGSNFTNVRYVKFGSTYANYTVNSSTQITATAPSFFFAGTVDVRVTTSRGTSRNTSADNYTYVAQPRVSMISPASGPVTGGTRVTIMGSGFTNVTAVNFGATKATAFRVYASTLIVATAPPGTGTVDVTVSTSGGTSPVSAGDRFRYLKITPRVWFWPAASAINLGEALSASILSGGMASVEGSFTFTDPSYVPTKTGTYSASVTFTPADTTTYNTVSGKVNVRVNKVSNNLSAATIAAIPDETYSGSALEPALTVTLGSSTLTPGTDYTAVYENNLNVGTATVTITGAGSYQGTKSATFTIVKATPEVATWPAASAITLGEALSASTLSGGAASVEGSFAFTNPDFVPTAVGSFSASVTFTPTDTANYNPVTGSAEVEVKADLSAATIEAIPDQTYSGSALEPALTVTLGSSTLAPGTDYTAVYENNLNVGTATVTITGAGSYQGTKSATFQIVKATPEVTTWPAASAITRGQEVLASTLSGGVASVEGTFTFTDPTAKPSLAGTYSAPVIFTPTDTANCNTVTGSVNVTVNENKAVTSFALKFTDKAGVVQTLGSWTYDRAALTFKDAGGTEAPFVKTFDPYLRYSGRDVLCSRLAVVTKGILLTDLADYAASATGIPVDGSATATGWAMTPNPTIDDLNNRYYYPSYAMFGSYPPDPAVEGEFDESTRVKIPAVLSILAYGNRNLAGTTDTGWGANPYLTALNGGTEVAVPTDEASLDNAFNVLARAADDDRSLRTYMGQAENDAYTANLGRYSTYNVKSITLTPVYFDITANVTSPDSLGTATITTDDTFLKAAATEPVSFDISGISTGYELEDVSVTDTLGNNVVVTETAGTYSFTMPASAVVINVPLSCPVTGVEVTPETVTLTTGETTQLAVSVLPSGATNKNVSWTSSDESVATVSGTGLVSAVAPGTATITVTTEEGSFQDSCQVTVEAIDLSAATIAAIPDETYSGSALEPALTVTLGSSTLTPGTDYTAVYTDNLNVGTATVTITGAGSYQGTTSATFQIVKATPEVTTWPAASAITLGEALTASTLSGGVASIDGSFAFTNPDFVPTAVGSFSASVTFTPTDTANYNPVTGSAEVEVKTISVTGISLDQTTATITIGNTNQLTATVAPDDATNKNVTWTSSDEAVATVDSTGLVTAVSAGSASITATTEDGGFTASCAVKVKLPIDTSWYTSDPGATTFTIDTAAELRGLSYLVNATEAEWTGLGLGTENPDYGGASRFAGKTIVLAADVWLNSTTGTSANDSSQYPWIPIGGGTTNSGTAASTQYSFGGTFDGGGHTVHNLYIDDDNRNQGLFGQVARGAVIKNVTVTGFIDADRSVGGVVGKNWGTVENCVNYASVYGDQSKGVGGIVGANWHDGAGASPVIRDCTNYGSVKTGYDTGLCGGVSGDNEGLIERCANYGTVSSATAGKGNVGGITGNLKYYSAGTVAATVEKCFNAGTIINGQWTGGIAAQVESGPSYILDCYNIGTVTGGGNTDYVGGILGNNKDGVVSITNCYNAATITAVNNAGAIAGRILTGSTTNNLYYLDGSAATAFATGTGTATATATLKTDAEMKEAVFAGEVSGITGRAFTPSTGTYPVLRWQIADTSVLESIAVTTSPAKTTYAPGEIFDPTGMMVTAYYSDSTHEAVTGYTYAPTEALSATDAKITVSYEGQTVDQSITVSIPVTGVTLDKETDAITTGNTTQLTATVAPADATNKNITWTTSNETVATVDSTGLVTAVAAGSATITATTEEGSFTATCAVTVNPVDSGLATVYLSGNTGSDTNDGTSIATAVKTFAKAKSLLKHTNGVIYLCSTSPSSSAVTLTGTETWDLTGYTNAKVLREPTHTGFGIFIETTGNLTLQNIVLDGNKANITEPSGAMLYSNGGRLTINDGCVIQNCRSGNWPSVLYTRNDYGCVTTINGGLITNNERVGTSGSSGGTILIGGGSTFTMNGGEISNNTSVFGAGGVEVWSAANFYGGTITGNAASDGSGDVSVGNSMVAVVGSAAHIAGTVYLYGNTVAKESHLDLTGALASPMTVKTQAALAGWPIIQCSSYTLTAADFAKVTYAGPDGWQTTLDTSANAIKIGIPVSGVALDKSASTLCVGRTDQLTATIAPAGAPNKTVTWSSDNESVATVDSTGLVTAVAVGAATITVTTVEGGFTATCAVTVNANLPATGIMLDKTAVAISPGGTTQLTATVVPAESASQKVTWSSDNESVATVSSTGLVTAGSDEGTAVITATSVDGGFTATCEVKVNLLTTVYLDGASGADTNDGLTAATAFKTFARAKQVLSLTDGTIYISGLATIASTETWDLTGYTGARVQRASGYTGCLAQVNSGGSLTLTNITIDGNKSSVISAYSLIYVKGGTATMNAGTVLQNNQSSISSYPAAVRVASGSFTMNGGQVINNTCTGTNAGGVGVTNSAAIFAMNGGEITGNTGGRGGGLCTASSNVTLNGGTVHGNTDTSGLGSGIYVNGTGISPTIGSSANISGTVYLSATTQYLNITGAPANGLTVQSVTPAENLAVAKGSSYTLTLADRDKFTYNGTGWYFGLDAVNNAIYLTTTSPTATPVTGVTLTPETVNLEVSATQQLTATVAPADATNQAVTYTSSNESVATVDSAGLVTALAGGTATITVTTTDGHFTDTCVVTVTAPVITPVITSLDAETVTTSSGGNTIPGLTYEAGPTLGGNEVTLTGTGFTGATNVYFGSTEATSFTVTSDTEITAVAPAGSAGEVQVTVAGTDGTTISNAVSYRYALWQVSGTVRGRWVTGLDEGNPVTNPENGGSLAGAFVYVSINALDPLYDNANKENNVVTFFDGTNWVDHAVTNASGTYTFSTAYFNGKPLPIGTIIDVVAVHDPSTFGTGAYAPDSDAWHTNFSVTQFGIYDRPNILVDFKNFTSTNGPDGKSLGNRVLPWDPDDTATSPPLPFEFFTPNITTDIS